MAGKSNGNRGRRPRKAGDGEITDDQMLSRLEIRMKDPDFAQAHPELTRHLRRLLSGQVEEGDGSQAAESILADALGIDVASKSNGQSPAAEGAGASGLENLLAIGMGGQRHDMINKMVEAAPDVLSALPLARIPPRMLGKILEALSTEQQWLYGAMPVGTIITLYLNGTIGREGKGRAEVVEMYTADMLRRRFMRRFGPHRGGGTFYDRARSMNQGGESPLYD